MLALLWAWRPRGPICFGVPNPCEVPSVPQLFAGEMTDGDQNQHDAESNDGLGDEAVQAQPPVEAGIHNEDELEDSVHNEDDLHDDACADLHSLWGANSDDDYPELYDPGSEYVPSDLEASECMQTGDTQSSAGLKLDETIQVGGMSFESVFKNDAVDHIVFNHLMRAQTCRNDDPFDALFSSPLTSFNPLLGTQIGALESAMSLSAIKIPVTMNQPTINLRRKRLLAARITRSDDQLFNAVLRKVRQLLLFQPEDSVMGQALLTAAGQLTPEHEILKTMSDALACKAVGTCVKRVNDYYRFAKWILADGIGRPMAPTERDVYGYIQHLELQGTGATAAESIIKAIGFMHGCFGFVNFNLNQVLSSRVRGAARKMLATKRPLRQAKLFSSDMIWSLENALHSHLDGFWSYFCGFVLFGLYSASRFSDLARAKGVRFEQYGQFTLLETETLHWKGSTLHERKMKPLRLMALGNGLHTLSWGYTWMQIRKQLNLSQDDWLMPGYDEDTGTWLNRPMTASEGCWYLRELMIAVGLEQSDAMEFSTHSMKRTMLHWIAVSMIFTFEERRCLGHHFDRNMQSPLTYSPEEMVILQSKVYRMLQAIRSGDLDPDLKAAELLRAQVMGQINIPEPEPSSCESSDAEFEQPDHEPLLPEKDHHERPVLPEGVECVFRHRLSGILHVPSDVPDVFMCGRKNSHNFQRIDDPHSDDARNAICIQCSTRLGIDA